jgi:hypothetical protein
MFKSELTILGLKLMVAFTFLATVEICKVKGNDTRNVATRLRHRKACNVSETRPAAILIFASRETQILWK